MKKYIICLFASLGFILFVSGCGGSNTSSTSVNSSTSIDMIIDKIYTIAKGQTITKTSEPTTIEINTNTQSGITTAVLKSGSAKIE